MENVKHIIECSPIMEHINSLRISQNQNERLHYNDIAIEAILSPVGKSKMVQQLYTDIINHSNIDFGDIPASKGDITKYKYYEQLFTSITTLNSLFGNNIPPEGVTLNKLHDLVIKLRSDFEFGFKFDIEIIKVTYNLLVYSLYEIVNVCILAYARYLKDVKNVEFSFTGQKYTGLIIIDYANTFIKGCEKGEWALFIKEFKGEGKGLIKELLLVMTTGLKSSSASAAPSALKSAIVQSASTPAGAIVYTIVAIVAVLFAIRGLIHLFYSSSAKLSSYIRNQAEFLSYNIEHSENNSPESLETQRKILDNMNNLVINIETKILKNNNIATKEIVKSNKDNFNSKEIASFNEISII